MTNQDPRIAKASKPFEEALRLHPLYRGKVQMMPKCPIRSLEDFSIWYTPGVAAVCQAIEGNPDSSYEHTNRANTIGIVSDGSRVLGLGNIGPLAGMPVMEGKALLFKYLGGVDAIPLCLQTQTADELISVVKALEPSLGGVNLEDIAQPKCFRVLDALRKELNIPVWHDDQQGTATVVLAGLMGALEVVGKSIHEARITLIGVGAANVANYRLLRAVGTPARNILACDSRGILNSRRDDLVRCQQEFPDKWLISQESNGDDIQGGIGEALRAADVCLAFSKSGPEIIRPEWVKEMARDAIVFACANPIPEIWPWLAKEAGARVVATGRSDFPNQVNNSLGFPGIFRGALDVRARTITEEMSIAAAQELVQCARDKGLTEEHVVPRMDDWEIYPRTAIATALAAQRGRVARLELSEAELRKTIAEKITASRQSCEQLMRLF